MKTTAAIYPSLSYDDAPAAIEWLCRAFGFQKRLVVPGPGGTVLHSELSYGSDVVIMVGSSKPRRRRPTTFSPCRRARSPAAMQNGGTSIETMAPAAHSADSPMRTY